MYKVAAKVAIITLGTITLLASYGLEKSMARPGVGVGGVGR